MKLLGLQLLGFLSVAAWTAVTITIVFFLIKAVFGLRVTEEEEIVGLDSKEHGLASAYAGFSIIDVSGGVMDVNENTDLGEDEYDVASETKKNAAVPVVEVPSVSASGIYKVVIIAKMNRYDTLRKSMNDLGVTGMTVTNVMGCGIQKGAGKCTVAWKWMQRCSQDQGGSGSQQDSCDGSHCRGKESIVHRTYRRRKDFCV